MATAPKDLDDAHEVEAARLLAEVVEAKRNDPAVRQWSLDSKKAVEDGSIWKKIKSQPEPHEIVERLRGEHS